MRKWKSFVIGFRFMFFLAVFLSAQISASASQAPTSAAGNPADGKHIEIENAEFKFIMSGQGRAISLVHKRSGQECLIPGTDAPLFAVTQYTPYDNELQLIYPAKTKTFAANSVIRNGDELTVTFDLINIVATIGLKITDGYIGFSLKKIGYNRPGFGDQRETQVDEFTILQLPVRNRSHFGEWLNVVWDEDVAVNLHSGLPTRSLRNTSVRLRKRRRR